MDKETKKKIKGELFKRNKDLASYLESQEISDKLDKLDEVGSKLDKLDKLDEVITHLKDGKRLSLDGIESIKGEKGDTPTEEELIAIVKPLIPEPIKGDDGEDGYTPIKGTDYSDGEDGYTPVKGKDYFDGINGRDGSPDTAEQIIEKINTLESSIKYTVIKGLPTAKDLVVQMRNLPLNERLDISDIKNWNQPAKGKLDQRWHGTGLANPMTTKGDIIYENASLVPARLGIGTTGQVLTVLAGLPVWQDNGNGSVTSVGVVSANGFSGSVATPTTTPAITISTTITGVLKGDGTAISAAVVGTDYQAPISLTTTGTSGAASFIANVLNIPQYQAAGTYVTSVSGTANRITSTGGTTPTIDISASYIGQASITTLGTIATGVWNGTVITGTYGGTGVNNGTKTFTYLKNISFTAADDTGTYTLPTGTKTLVATDVTTLPSLVSVGTITTGVWTGTTIAVANGGTGQTSYTDGQLLIGNTTGNTLAKASLTGTTNQITVTNGSGSVTLSTPQNINTGATPQFARLGLGAAADANHILLLSGGTITTDNHQIDSAVTWNAAGVTFTAWKLNVTSTASAALSLLADLQVASASQFSVNKSGLVTTKGLTINGTTNGILSTITGSASVVAGDFVNDSSSASEPAVYARNNTNFAYTSTTGILRAKLVNGSDSGVVANFENAGTGDYIRCDANFRVAKSGKATTYSGIATVSNGVASELAQINTTALTANVSAATLYSVPAAGAGMYRINAYVVLTTAGSVSSTLPNVQVVYTDNDTGGAITMDATPVLGIAGIGQTGALTTNTIGTAVAGVIVVNAKASTTIQYQTVNYASTAAGMAYALHIRLEAM